MATDIGFEGLHARLTAVQHSLDGDFSAVGHAVGRGARVEVTAVANRVAGGDAVLSGFGRRGAKLGMGYDLEDKGRRVVVKLRPPGPWVIVEQGARRHQIGRGRRRRAAGARFLKGAGYPHPVRGPIEHPGARGKHGITEAFGGIRAGASRDAHQAWVKELSKVMG